MRLVSGACGKCPDARGRLLALDRSVAVFREVRKALGLPELRIEEEESPVKREPGRAPVSRRELFTSFLPDLGEAGPGAAAALRAEILAVGGGEAAAELACAPFGAPVLDGECEACGLCAKLCPSGALESENRDVFRLVLSHGMCVACGTCVAGCAAGALRLRRELPSGEARREVLVEREIEECGRCGAPLTDGSEICVSCRRRGPARRWAP